MNILVPEPEDVSMESLLLMNTGELDDRFLNPVC